MHSSRLVTDLAVCGINDTCHLQLYLSNILCPLTLVSSSVPTPGQSDKGNSSRSSAEACIPTMCCQPDWRYERNQTHALTPNSITPSPLSKKKLPIGHGWIIYDRPTSFFVVFSARVQLFFTFLLVYTTGKKKLRALGQKKTDNGAPKLRGFLNVTYFPTTKRRKKNAILLGFIFYFVAHWCVVRVSCVPRISDDGSPW